LRSASCARRSRAAETSLSARVICWVDLADAIRRRIALSDAMVERYRDYAAVAGAAALFSDWNDCR
jgi:hypothetical protein